MDRITLLFSGAHRQGRKMLTYSEMATVATVQGVSRKNIDAAVRAGDLRRGVDGYWLPEAPDPGALAVMRRAMHETVNTEEV